jgi:hypothetical protein
VELQHIFAPGSVVESIDVLGDEGEAGDPFFEFDQREMTFIGSEGSQYLSSPVIEFPDKPWVSRKRLGCCKIRCAILPPYAFFTSEGGNSRFGGYPGTRENCNSF